MVEEKLGQRWLADLMDLNGEIDLDNGYGFVSPYLLVYGTLRKGQKRFQEFNLDTQCHHHGTFRLRNWALTQGKYPFAVPVDSPESSIVVDLLELCPNRNSPQPKADQARDFQILYEMNFLLDMYEGTLEEDAEYRSVIIPVEVEKGADLIYAKMYFTENVDNPVIPTGDFAEQTKFVKYNFLTVWADTIRSGTGIALKS